MCVCSVVGGADVAAALIACLHPVIRHMCLPKHNTRVTGFAGKALLKEALSFLDRVTSATPTLNWSSAWQQVEYSVLTVYLFSADSVPMFGENKR
jgi:hypothetical protein